MKLRHLWTTLCLLLLPIPLLAQEAQSLGIGSAATASPMGIFSIIWNPSVLAEPEGVDTAWEIASGFSAFDTSNSGSPIIHFVPNDALGASQDPISRFQQYQGLFAVRYLNAAGGVLWNQELDYLSSQGALQFFHDRDNNSIGAGSSYSLNYQQTTQQVANLVISYGMPLPLGSLQMFSVGGSLKYHDGLQYEQTSIDGNFTQGSSPVTFTRTTSSSGLGLSIDLGFFTKLSDALQAGLMLENLQSNFNWQAQQQSYVLNQTNGAESPVGSPTNVTVAAPFPYTTKLGLAMSPPEKNIALETEVSWFLHQTRWRVGMQRYYPEANLVVRLGTFSDQVSNQQMWTFGAGYLIKNFNVDLSFLTRSIPDLQNSIALGGALDAEVRF